MTNEPKFADLDATGDVQRDAADQLTTAAERLAREANGTRSSVTPAPVAYDLLGNLKVSLSLLTEVVQHLPQGLERSLHDERLDVYDQDPWTGVVRDPVHQVDLASGHLTKAAQRLQAAVTHAEAAQSALGCQGYRLRR